MSEDCVPSQHCSCTGADGCFGCESGRKWLETPEGKEAFAKSRGLDAGSQKREQQKAASAKKELESRELQRKEQAATAQHEKNKGAKASQRSAALAHAGKKPL